MIDYFLLQVVGLVGGLGMSWLATFGLILTLYFYSHNFFASGTSVVLIVLEIYVINTQRFALLQVLPTLVPCTRPFCRSLSPAAPLGSWQHWPWVSDQELSHHGMMHLLPTV